MTKIKSPALRYFGGKWRLAAWIISAFPIHTCYVEPFGGAMSVLLRKAPSDLDVYNDLDQDVVNFFRVLREHPEELLRAIRLSPFARQELRTAYEPCADAIERARRLYIRATQSIGGPRTQWNSGWRFQTTNSRGKRALDDLLDSDHLAQIAERLRTVYIECDQALAIIGRYDRPTTLFYCDPPYVVETRSLRWRHASYQHEMDENQHRALAEVLHNIQGMALISGYPSGLYDELYSGWEVRQCHSRTNTIRNGGKVAVECLWISPNAARASLQKSLF